MGEPIKCRRCSGSKIDPDHGINCHGWNCSVKFPRGVERAPEGRSRNEWVLNPCVRPCEQCQGAGWVIPFWPIALVILAIGGYLFMNPDVIPLLIQEMKK